MSMSQRQVARALGLSRPTLRAIERRALIKLAHALGWETDLELTAWQSAHFGGGRGEYRRIHNRRRCTRPR